MTRERDAKGRFIKAEDRLVQQSALSDAQARPNADEAAGVPGTLIEPEVVSSLSSACGKGSNDHGSVAEVRTLARSCSQEAIARIVELTSSDNERVALAACQELLNRAMGRPAQGGTKEDPKGPAMVEIRWLGDE